MSITSRINEMSSHIEQAYDELQGLGADLTNVNKNIENISMVLDDIYDSMPQVSGEGTSLTLDDTRVGKIKSTLKGNTSQSGTPTPTSPIPINVVSGDNEINVVGKNSYNINANYDWIGANTNYTITDNTINVNGKYFVAGLHSVKSNTDYTISATRQIIQDNSSCGTIRVFTPDKSQMLGEGKTTFTFNTGNNNQVYVLLYAGLNEQGNVDFSNIQLEQGSSASSYLPYSGNTYNIDLPVENLFDTSLLPMTKNGVTISKDDEGNVVLNGTPTITSGYIGFDFTLSSTYLKAGTYTSSIKNKIGGIGITINQTTPGGILNLTMSDTVNSKTGTLTADLINGTIGVNVRYDVGTLTNFILNPQLEIGSKAHKYTPYGTTPIELCKIGNYEDKFIRTSGKNLFDKDSISNGFLDESGIVGGDTSAYRTSDFIPILPNTAYYKTITSSPRAKYYDKNKQPLNTTTYWDIPIGGNAGTFTTPSNAYYFRFSYPVTGVNANSIMINKGTTAIDYEPYGSGEWYLHKEIGKVVLNGSESWFAETQRYRADNIIQGKTFTSFDENNPLAYCEGFKWGNGTSSYFVYGAFWYTSNGLNLSLQKDENPNATTLANFKTWLGSNNQNVRYVLATPTYTKITYEPLLDQLNLLEKAMSKDGQTNISQVNNDLPFIISASALKEWSV